MAERVEYKIIMNTPNVSVTENELNELSKKEGWRAIGFNQHQILLEKVIENEKQEVEQING